MVDVQLSMVVLEVRDLGASIDFYRLLGLELRTRQLIVR